MGPYCSNPVMDLRMLKKKRKERKKMFRLCI
jgi:hypothetical protein